MKDMLKKSTILAAAAALMAGATACGPTVPMGPQGQVMNPAARFGAFNNGAARVARNGKKWSIFVHLAADNNLYSAGLDDINEMEAGLGRNPAAAEAIDVIVLFDGLRKGDSAIYRIKPEPGAVNSKIVSEIIDDKGAIVPPSKEIDSGDPVLAAKFLDWATANFPSQHNGYVIWNHGDGWARRAGGVPPELGGGASFFETVIGGDAAGRRTAGVNSRSFASDDNGGHMATSDITPILAAGVKNLKRPFDTFNFDACLMAHIELAYQAKGGANILIASEELEPGDGDDYAAYLGNLAQNPNMNPVQFAKNVVDTYVKSYMPGGSQRGSDITKSAMDVNAVVNTFVPALNQLATEMTAALPTEKAAIASARQSTQVFYNRDVADIGDFVRKFAASSRNPRIGAAASRLQQAMSQTIIAEGHYGADVANATGAVLYFPTATMNYNRRYDDPNFIRFAETQAWGNFLKAFTAK